MTFSDLIPPGLMKWIEDIYGFIDHYSVWLLAALLVLLILTGIGLKISLARAKEMKARWRQAILITKNLQPKQDLEQNMSDILEQVSELLDAPTYVMYIYDEVKQVYLMKAVRHRSQDFGKVEPSYSGLVEYKKEQYLPPLSLPANDVPEEIRQEKAGEVTLLQIPVGKQQGLIRVGPMMGGRLAKRTKQNLAHFTETLTYTLRNLISIEQIRNQANVIVSTGEALKRINGIALDTKTTIDFVLNLSANVMNADGAFFAELSQDEYTLTAVTGTDPELSKEFEKGKPTGELFFVQSNDSDIRLITPEDDAFYEIPPHVAAIGAEAYALIDVSERREKRRSRMFVLWFQQSPTRLQWEEAQQSLHMLADSMREVLGYQWSLQKFSGIYVHILKTVAQIQDNLIPYTVGYSELMSRYSIVIAKQLGLEDELIHDIALAAYLSNIGVIGISGDLVNKEGKFTEEEYESMKLHAEVGASIVQTTIGNERVASYIMHHHERMDGNGYPAGLAGEDIPIGSRIIGVVQTMLAVLNGRKYRDPLPFEKAMQILQSAAGSQLDERVVTVFMDWFAQKRAEPQVAGRSLGACWEMCCTPSSICEQCPAFKQTERNCWEFPDNNCQAHGKRCETCFVRTETLSRKEHQFQ